MTVIHRLRRGLDRILSQRCVSNSTTAFGVYRSPGKSESIKQAGHADRSPGLPKRNIILIDCRNSWILLLLKAGTVAVRSRLAPEFMEFDCLAPEDPFTVLELQAWEPGHHVFPIYPSVSTLINRHLDVRLLFSATGSRRDQTQSPVFSSRSLYSMCLSSRVGPPNTCSQVSVPYNVTQV